MATSFERRPVKGGCLLVYTIGRSYLLELFHTELQSNLVRFATGPATRRAYEQLAKLELAFRDSGMVYNCPVGLHDDLGISCAMLAWAARHPHLPFWLRTLEPKPRRIKRDTSNWALGWT